MKYGYLPATEPRTEKQLEEALKLFQRVAGIPETGKPDRRTWHVIRQSRCGDSDFVSSGSRRHKRYVLQGTKWNKKVKQKLIVVISLSLF